MLHDDEFEAILRPDVMDNADVGMLQPRDGFRFTLEALMPVRIGRQVRGKDFDRDLTAQARIEGKVHFAHAAGADRCFDFVRSETRAG
jgi:hypothetical protein